MIAVSNDFKNAMKQPVKELQAYINDIKSADDLISFKISCETGLCKTAMRKLEAKYTGEHNLLGQWVHAGFGVKLPSGAFEYLEYGSFLVTEITHVKDTGITTIVGYDKMINSMTPYVPLDIEYPISLIDYTKLLCNACNLELGSELLGNEATVVEATGTNTVNLTNSLNSNPKEFIVEGKSEQDATPTPDTPVDIKTIGYTNLFDTETLKQYGVYQYALGNQYAGYKVQLKPNTKYLLKVFANGWVGDAGWIYALFNCNKVKLRDLQASGINSDVQVSFTTDDTGVIYFGALYRSQARLDAWLGTVNIQLEEGEKIHSNIDYGKYGVDVKYCGKNLFNYVDYFLSTNDTLTNTINSDGSISVSGVPPISWAGIVSRHNIDEILENGETYTISEKSYHKEVFLEVRAQNKTDGSYIYYQRDKTFVVDLDNYTYTATLICGTLENWGTEPKTITNYWQLEKGDKATEFEPYKSKSTQFVLNEPLRSLPSGVKDKAYIKNGKLYVERNLAQKDVTSSMFSSFSNQLTKSKELRIKMTSFDNLDVTHKSYLSNRYQYINNTWDIDTVGLVSRAGNPISEVAFRIPIDENSSYLDTHPVYLVYKLAEPIIEEYGTIDIPLFKGTNNVFVSSNLNVNFSLTYYQSLEDRLYNKMNDWLITKELWENIEGITYRDIFVQIAQATGTTCIISNDKVYFKSLTATGEQLTYDNMFKLKLEPKYGEINSIVLSRTPQEDNIYMRDETSVKDNGLTEFKIENNEIIDKDRDNAMTPIYEALKGISYYPFESTTEGLGWYEIGDKLDIVNDMGDVFNTALFNLNITIDGSIKEILKTVAETKTQTQYQYATTIAKRVKNTEIIVNKQEQYIESLVTDVYSEKGIVNENFTKIYQDIHNIVNNVQNSGGGNLIKNSVMFAYDGDNVNDWEVTEDGNIIIDSNTESLSAGGLSGHSFTLKNKIASQKILVNTNSYYSFSTKIKKGLDGSCYVKLYNSNEEYIIELKEGEEAFYKEYELKSLSPKDNYYIIEFYGSADSDATFTDNMFSLGEYKSQWTQANGEIMNTQVNVNLNGVLVKSSVYLGDYTVMSPLEFAGYSNINGTITKVFTLNKDVTYMTKAEVKDEFRMVPIKIVPITTGDLQGWAFVPSIEEV